MVSLGGVPLGGLVAWWPLVVTLLLPLVAKHSLTVTLGGGGGSWWSHFLIPLAIGFNVSWRWLLQLTL